MGRLATHAYEMGRPLIDLCAADREVSDRLSVPVLQEITNPLVYFGESRKIVRAVYDAFHGKKTIPRPDARFSKSIQIPRTHSPGA